MSEEIIKSAKVELTEEEKLAKKAKRDFDKALKLYTSQIFSRVPKYIYLNRAYPNQMICTSFAPNEVTGRARNVSDILHFVETKGVDLFQYWDTLLPFKNIDICCISTSGIDAVKKKTGGGFEDIEKFWSINEITGLRYYIKLEQVGKRKKKVVKPIIWPLSELFLRELFIIKDNVLNMFQEANQKYTYELIPSSVKFNEMHLISVGDKGLAKGIKLPVTGGFDMVGTSGYARAAKLEKIDVHIVQDGNVVCWRTESEDELTKVSSFVPQRFMFPTS